MIWTIVRIKLQDIGLTVNSCIRLSIQRSFVFASGTPTPIVVDLFGESTITVVNKYSAFRCKSRYKSKGGVQGQNSPFTPVQFTTRICAFKWTKANPRKDYVPCAVESFTVYTCCSYYRRWIRTSLSSLQSHVLTSLHGRPQARAREGGSFDPPGRLKHSSVTAS